MILHGDVTDKLKEIESDSIQCVVTSPPYWGLRNYQMEGQLGLEETPELYVENMVNVFREIKRVIKDDGTLWLNLGDSYAGGGKGNYGSGISTHNGTVSKHPKGSDFKTPNLKTKDLVGIPWRVAFALQADGWYLRQDIIWHKPNPMPESVKDRCTKSHEYIFLLTKSAKYFYDADALREPADTKPHKMGGTQASSDRNDGDRQDVVIGDGFRNKRSVWKITTKPYKEAHFAVFPPKIPELCIKAGSKEGDIVLDPFFGSGTTGWVAQRLGRKWIGIELNAEYIKIAEKRFLQRELFTGEIK